MNLNCKIAFGHSIRLMLIGMALGLLASCGSTSLTVGGTYPYPLTSPLPLSATLLLDDNFRNYVATPSKNITMNMGFAQTQMMTSVLDRRFKILNIVSELPAVIDTDILIVAKVEGVQIGTPKETHLSVYEVWIKYNLEISSNTSELISKWFMPAYGKSQSAFMKSDAAAIDSAAQFALRDAGVRLITDLHRIPEFRYWLKQHQKRSDRVIKERDEGRAGPGEIADKPI